MEYIHCETCRDCIYYKRARETSGHYSAGRWWFICPISKKRIDTWGSKNRTECKFKKVVD